MKSKLEPTQKNAECDHSEIAYTEDSESFLENYGKNKKQKLIQLNTKPLSSNRNIELVNVKQLPTIFFLIFITILAMLTANFVPQMIVMGKNPNLYKDKLSVKYVAEYLGDQSLAVKGVTIASQFILAFIIICLTSLIRQRISVPELIGEKWRNYCIVISSSVSVSCMIILLYFNKETLAFSHKSLGMIDNVSFLVYIVSSFIYCFMTYQMLAKLSIREVPKDCSCIVFKKYLILLMAMQVICYSLSDFLVSVYTPVIESEKYLLSILIVCLNANSLLFLLCQVLFIFSLKYDLYYVNLNLQIRPDLEYFVDFDEMNNFKSSL